MSGSDQSVTAPHTGEPLLAAGGLEIGIEKRLLVKGLELAVNTGECICILGKNGAGKTTLLHTLAGLRPAQAGTVRLDGEPLAEVRRRSVAQRLGLLMQTYEDPFPATVLETALIGRHPHIDFWRAQTPEDLDCARTSLAQVGLAGLEDRPITTLSGGERRRLAVAMILTQAPSLYLLDEPVNHLDPHHQLAVLAIFRALANRGRAAVISLHDVNLAARFCDRALLLFGDGRWILGERDSVLTGENLSRLYETEITVVDWQDRRLFVTA